MAKISYSPKAAAAGKDIGKPGKNFAAIAAKSGGGTAANITFTFQPTQYVMICNPTADARL